MKEFTSILNGTTGSVELGWGLSAFLGLMYILGWLAFVILVPILLLAAAMLVIWYGVSSGVTSSVRSSRREEALTSASNK